MEKVDCIIVDIYLISQILLGVVFKLGRECRSVISCVESYATVIQLLLCNYNEVDQFFKACV